MNKLKQANQQLFLFSLFKVPLILLCRPKIIHLSEQKLSLKIKLNFLTRNHLGSMYFGALAIGADIAGGFMAFAKAKQHDLDINFAFKDVSAEFIKRPEADVVFQCEDGKLIDNMINTAKRSKQRVKQQVTVVAHCPSISPEPVAIFILTLSLRIKNSND